MSVERERLRQAKILGAASGLRGVIDRDTNLYRQAEHRAQWPELWERIDQVAALIDWR